MNYQRILVADQSEIGEPGPLPPELVGLSDESLADLSAALNADACDVLGFTGQGFLPVPDPEPPAPPRNISAIAFKQRLTGAERRAIRAASATDEVIADFLDLLNTPGAGLVDLDHADTVNGCAYLVAQELLSSERAAEIRI